MIAKLGSKPGMLAAVLAIKYLFSLRTYIYSSTPKFVIFSIFC
jgi:hypothetical protein